MLVSGSGKVLSAPAVNPHASITPPQKERPPIFAQSLKKCTNDTAESIEHLVAAMACFKFAMQPIKPPRWENAASGIVWGFEILFKAAAPAFGVVLVAKGAPGATVGVCKTAIVGAAHVGERVVSAVVQKYIQIRGTIPEEQRRHLTRLFIERMHKSLEPLDRNDKESFRSNPKQLINVSALAVAFLSRDLMGSQLKVGDSVLTENQVARFSLYHQQCFQDICKVKQTMQGVLLISQNWIDLMNIMSNFELVKPAAVYDDDWEMVPDKKDFTLQAKDPSLVKLNREQLAHLKNLFIHTFNFSDLVADDDVFKSEWKNSWLNRRAEPL